MSDPVKLMNYLNAVKNLATARADEHAFTMHGIPYRDSAVSVRQRRADLYVISIDFVGVAQADELLSSLDDDPKPRCPICTPDANVDDEPPLVLNPRRPSLRKWLRARWSL